MVTPTEKAKRSEALYYDNHNITRRTLCDRVVNLESDMEEIKAENAKLQNENARLRSCLSDDAENARMIMAENAKLRELVRDLYEMAYPEYPSAFEAAFADRMRELGIEVE